MYAWIAAAGFLALLCTLLVAERRKLQLQEQRIQELQREIGTRECIERQLQASQSNLEMATEASGIGTWYWDLQTDEFFCSEQALRLFGFEKTNRHYRSADFLALVHPDDQNRLRIALENAFRGGGRYQVDYRILRPDSKVVWLLTSGRGWKDSDGDVRRVAGITADVTDRKRLEENFYQSQKMEAVGRLAGGVAHDFNNMLGVISAYAELLNADPELPASAGKRVVEIMSATQRAHALTRQLLTFSRKQVITPASLDLNAAILGVADMMQRLVGADIRMATHLSEKLPPIQADQGQIEQMLLNFAANSRDAMQRGGRFELKTSFQKMDPESGRPLDRGFVLLELSDNGCGMSAETKKHLFEPFFTTKPAGLGTGLGLATIYGVVEQMKGRIQVESAENVGTTFRVYLPALATPVAQTTPNTRQKETSAKILLVEDETALRDILAEFLASAGMQVVGADSGSEALAKIESGEQVDLLLTDLAMPGMDGRTLAQAVRSRRPGLQVIFMSGHADDAVTPPELLQDGHACLRKPFSRTDLVNAIHATLPAKA